MQRIRKTVLTAILILVASSAETWADTVEVELQHTASKKWATTTPLPDGRNLTIGEDPKKAELILDRRENATVTVADYNPLLFSYDGSVEESPSAGFQALSQFLSALGITEEAEEEGEMAEATADAVHCTSVLIGNLDLDQLASDAQWIAWAQDQIPDYIDATLQSSTLPGAVSSVSDWEVTAVAKTVTDAIPKISALKNKEEASITCVIKIEDEDTGQEQLTRKVVGTVPMYRPVDPHDFRGVKNDVHITRLINTFFWDPHVNLDDLISVTKVLKRFKERMMQVHQPYTPEKLRGITYDPAKNKTAKVEVTASNAFGPFLSDEAKVFQERHKGTFQVTFLPKERIHLNFSAGAVYSFVRNPDFAGEAADDGKLTIVETSNDYNELDIAAKLELIPDKYFGYGVEPFLEIGILPDSDKAALLLGLGFKAYQRLTLSVGVIYQQVNTLEAGLEVGQTIDSLDDLKIDSDFKTGLYLQLGIRGFKLGQNQDSQ